MTTTPAPRRRRPARRAMAAAFGAASLLAACSGVGDGADETAAGAAGTVVGGEPGVVDTVAGVGRLPAFVGAVAPSSRPEQAGAGVALDPSGASALGRTPAGNDVLFIGDSIFASTATRLGGEMCRALEPLGWRVAVEAEVSRQVTFGVDVMRARGDEGWDVGVVFLGTNYNGDSADYLKNLNRIITEFDRAPVVLLTASRYSDAMDEVNETIRGLDDLYPHVSVIDWGAVTADDPGLLTADGIHPSSAGRKMLTALVASHLGKAPADAAGTPAEGDCLESLFVDDSAGEIPALDAPGGSSSTGTSSSGTSSTGTSQPTTTSAGSGGATSGTGDANGAGTDGDPDGAASGDDSGTGDGASDATPDVPAEDPEQELPPDVDA